MKKTFHLTLCGFLTVICWSAANTPAAAADDLKTSYQQGRALFYAGQLEAAREKLAPVLAKNPNHLETQAMMAQIKQQLGEGENTLKSSYQKVVLEKVEFSNVELSEALQAVRFLSRKATNEKISANVIVANPELAKKPVSINLTQVPLSEVINYLAQMAGAKVTYDKVAVVLSPKDG